MRLFNALILALLLTSCIKHEPRLSHGWSVWYWQVGDEVIADVDESTNIGFNFTDYWQRIDFVYDDRYYRTKYELLEKDGRDYMLIEGSAFSKLNGSYTMEIRLVDKWSNEHALILQSETAYIYCIAFFKPDWK